MRQNPRSSDTQHPVITIDLNSSYGKPGILLLIPLFYVFSSNLWGKLDCWVAGDVVTLNLDVQKDRSLVRKQSGLVNRRGGRAVFGTSKCFERGAVQVKADDIVNALVDVQANCCTLTNVTGKRAGYPISFLRLISNMFQEHNQIAEDRSYNVLATT